MSVRHIHARPGEYIAVHRSGGAAAGGRESLTAVGIIAVILAVVFFWEIILKAILFACAVVLAVALASGVLYLLWTFRQQLWRGTCWIARILWSGICWLSPKVWIGVCWMAKTLWCGAIWFVRKPLAGAASWCWTKCRAIGEAIRNRSRKRLGMR